MQNRRTDLALEARELWRESAGETAKLEGVEAEECEKQGIPVTTVRILNEQGERELGKPRGTYVTLELDGLPGRSGDIFHRAVESFSGELRDMVEQLAPTGLVLTAGLGNRAITPDALGPLVHENILVTRHLVKHLPEQFGTMRPVASLAAEVLATTGVESGELIKSVCQRIRPACVIAVDALASRSVDRLCRTVQLSDTGITPGSGVGNHRTGLNRETLGVPVLAVGVPTVVDGATLAADLTGQETTSKAGKNLFVTPKDIDSQMADLSKVIGWGISLALQPSLTMEDLELLLA